MDVDYFDLWIGLEEASVPVKTGDQWELLFKGEKIVSEKYDVIIHDYFLYMAKSGDEWICLDMEGSVQSDMTFWDAFYYSEGISAVRKEGFYGYVNADGKEVTKFEYQHASSASEGMACIKKGGKYGYIKTDGSMVIEPQFEYAQKFSEGLAAAKSNGLYGFIDKTGQYVLPAEYENAGNFYGELVSAKKNGKWGFIDKSGTKIIDFQFAGAYDFDESGYAIARNSWTERFFINKKGEILGGHIFKKVDDFKNGYAKVKNADDKTMWVDLTGKLYDKKPEKNDE